MHLYSGGCLCPLSISICPLRVSHAFGEMIAQNIVSVEVLIPVSEHFAGLDVLQSSKTKVLGEGTSRGANPRRASLRGALLGYFENL